MSRRSRMIVGLAACSCLAAAALGDEPTKEPAQGPVTAITGKMTAVADDLGRMKTGKPVQAKEKEILDGLDELIARLEKERQAAQNGIKMNNPSRPLADSVIRGGTGGIGDLVAPGESNKDWARLSGRERDRIIQSMSEGFPPEYRLVLERYYRRIAEEKTAPAGGENTPAPPKAEEKAGKR